MRSIVSEPRRPRPGGGQLPLFPSPAAPGPPPSVLDEAARRRRATAEGVRFLVLGSGSGGNSVLVETPEGCLLIDAGFSCRNLEARLRVAGVDPRTVQAILLTHEHNDHVRGVERFVRRFRPRVLGTRGTFWGATLRGLRREEVRCDVPVELLGLSITAFPVPHDAREPVGYVLEDGSGRRLGLASDLGCRTQRAWEALRDVDALIIESNHDLHMLEKGPYPFALKRRVASRRGHLSNDEAGEGVRELLHDRLGTVVLYHLSRTNNRPGLAREAMQELLDREGASPTLVVSDQFEPSSWCTLGAPAGS